MIDPKIEESWREVLFDEFQKPYFEELKRFLVEEKQRHTIYRMVQMSLPHLTTLRLIM